MYIKTAGRSLLLCLTTAVSLMAANSVTYPIVDTGQKRCYSNHGEITFPKETEPFGGQDANYQGNEPSYKDNRDGTVSDLVTGLMWQKTPDLINKSTFTNALSGATSLTLGGHSDWRLPTIKELYSLINFEGHGCRKGEGFKPYILTEFFDFVFGREHLGERLIDAQYWSATEYKGRTMRNSPTVFGVNFADGRIKGYPRFHPHHGEQKMFVRYVRGNTSYGKNNLTDNGNGTVTDNATGLMWMKSDSAFPMPWKEALAYAENLQCSGYNDWRLPNAKELQSIVDYSRAPDAVEKSNQGPAISPMFNLTKDESYFWTGTTHLDGPTCSTAVYIAFGQAFGHMFGKFINVHGAGAQRSDPKTGNPASFPRGRGPQGDDIRILNYVRCVRGGAAKIVKTGPELGTTRIGERRMNFEEKEESKYRRFIKRLDRDGDNKISIEEFDGPPIHFNEIDQNNDGFIDISESPAGPPERRWIFDMFRNF